MFDLELEAGGRKPGPAAFLDDLFIGNSMHNIINARDGF